MAAFQSERFLHRSVLLVRFYFLCLILLLCSGDRFIRRYRNSDLILTYFDVGQGDSTLLQLPNGRTMLIDAGGGFANWNIGTRAIFPELARLGILQLDIALLSHPDQDHGYGFLGLMEQIKIKEFWYNSVFLSDKKAPKLFRSLYVLAQSRGIKQVGFDKETSIAFEDTRFTLFPLRAKGQTNNRSLVLLLEFGQCTALFSGDIEKEAEDYLAQRTLPKINFLKVAHHGSQTSSTERLLERISPKLAVVSAGMTNRYGHPNSKALRRLQMSGAQVFRTDFHGYVNLTISPDGWYTCRTARGFCGMDRCKN